MGRVAERTRQKTRLVAVTEMPTTILTTWDLFRSKGFNVKTEHKKTFDLVKVNCKVFSGESYEKSTVMKCKLEMHLTQRQRDAKLILLAQEVWTWKQELESLFSDDSV